MHQLPFLTKLIPSQLYCVLPQIQCRDDFCYPSQVIRSRRTPYPIHINYSFRLHPSLSRLFTLSLVTGYPLFLINSFILSGFLFFFFFALHSKASEFALSRNCWQIGESYQG